MILGALISGIGKEEFAREYWGEHRYHCRTDEAFWTGIFSLEAFTNVINSSSLNVSDVLVSKNGHHPPFTLLEPRSLGGQRLDRRALHAALTDGYTIGIVGLEAYHQPVNRICQCLEEELGHPVSVNCYYTPPGANGFGCHYDPFEAFIVQLVGEKLWRIQSPIEKYPAPQDTHDVSFSDEAPIQSITLQPGDTMYLPRGWLHDVGTTDTASLHLVLGAYPIRYCDVLSSIWLAEAEVKAALRKGISVLSTADLSSLVEELTKHCPGISEKRVKSALAFIRSTRMRRQPNEFTLPTKVRMEEIVDTSYISMLKPSEVTSTSRNTFLEYPGGRLAFPILALPALRLISTRGGILVKELRQRLSDESLMQLIGALSEAGLIVVENDSNP